MANESDIDMLCAERRTVAGRKVQSRLAYAEAAIPDSQEI